MGKKKKKKSQNLEQYQDNQDFDAQNGLKASILTQSPFKDALLQLRTDNESRISAAPDTLPPPAPTKPPLLQTPSPEKSPQTKKQKSISSEEREELLLKQVYSGVTPIKRKKSSSRSKQNATNEQRKSPRYLSASQSFAQGTYRFNVQRSETGLIEGIRAGKSKEILDKTASAKHFPTAELDLHGLLQDEAHKEVLRFLRQKQQAGHELVLIIYGKGLHSEGAPVLGDLVINLITEGQAAPFVLAFASAPTREGGKGALRVRLV